MKFSVRLDVSHMRVRMALRELEAEGILSINPHRGATVRQVDHTFLCHLVDLHSAVEGMLVKRYINIVNVTEISRLKERATAFERAASSNNWRALLATKDPFHSHINLAVGNAEAIRVLKQGRLLVQALRLRIGYDSTSWGYSSRSIPPVDAIATKNADLASNLIRQHSESSRKELVSFVTYA